MMANRTWKRCRSTLNGLTASEPAQPREAHIRTGREPCIAGNTARLCLACLVLLNAACTHFGAVDKPLKEWTPDLPQRLIKQVKGDRSPEIALQELAATEITTAKGSRSLLREVDIISSVSGGSFTAAYYGLHGEQIFTDFEPHFLRKDVEGVLFRKMFNPLNWVHLLSRSYGRSDLAAEYYDKILFKGATFADLQRPDAPLIDINATDLGTGDRFPLVQWTFDMICADFGSYPLSRAVAASSAVPVIFSPVTLENFAGSCGFKSPAWPEAALKDKALTPRKIEARRFQSYLDRKERPWLHLVDGGIADNLGLRAFYSSLNIAAEPGLQHRELGYADARHVIIISVNAFAQHKSRWSLERYAPSLFEIVERVSADQISRYSEDTVQLVRSTFESWAKKKSTPQRAVTFHLVDVSFAAVDDDSERDFLNGIGTNFDLSDEQVDRLIAAARKVLRESTEFQAFIKLNRGHN
jgi:NTE family protein